MRTLKVIMAVLILLGCGHVGEHTKAILGQNTGTSESSEGDKCILKCIPTAPEYNKDVPSVVGKEYVRPVLTEEECADPLNQCVEMTYNETLSFGDDGYVSLFFHSLDYGDAVPYIQCGLNITVDIKDSAVFSDEADKKSAWQISADGRVLTNTVEKQAYMLGTSHLEGY